MVVIAAVVVTVVVTSVVVVMPVTMTVIKPMTVIIVAVSMSVIVAVVTVVVTVPMAVVVTVSVTVIAGAGMGFLVAGANYVVAVSVGVNNDALFVNFFIVNSLEVATNIDTAVGAFVIVSGRLRVVRRDVAN